jgi:hypothetical protein
MTLLEQFADRFNDKVASAIRDGVAEIVGDTRGLH